MIRDRRPSPLCVPLFSSRPWLASSRSTDLAGLAIPRPGDEIGALLEQRLLLHAHRGRALEILQPVLDVARDLERGEAALAQLDDVLGRDGGRRFPRLGLDV